MANVQIIFLICICIISHWNSYTFTENWLVVLFLYNLVSLLFQGSWCSTNSSKSLSLTDWGTKSNMLPCQCNLSSGTPNLMMRRADTLQNNAPFLKALQLLCSSSVRRPCSPLFTSHYPPDSSTNNSLLCVSAAPWHCEYALADNDAHLKKVFLEAFVELCFTFTNEEKKITTSDPLCFFSRTEAVIIMVPNPLNTC